ncbi:vesicular glutamate transporter 2-like isoform X2 [Bacillus rossius redtenbacheri]
MSINIAIIGMVRDRSSGPDSLDTAERCYNATAARAAGNATVARASSLVDTVEDKVDWDEYQQNLVLGAAFWLYWLTQVPGGVLTHRYGTKVVLGAANYTMCLLGLLIPFATFRSFHLLIVIRVLQGFSGGFVWPALHAVTAAWIPPNERGKFISAYTGNSLGTALTFPLCGQIVYWFGWRMVFYMTGVLGTVWLLAWYLLMFDSPAQHPRISQAERRYIEESLASSHTEKKLRTPWKAIVTSVPMWLLIFTQWGNLWCLNLALTQAPTYLYTIHGWNIQMTGVMSGIPHILRIGSAIGSSVIFDMLLQKEHLSRTAVRKLAVAICCIGQGLAMVGMAFSGCNAVMAMVFMMIAIAIQSLDSSGQMASFVDLSPNFASILLGIANAVSVLTGFAAPTLVGLLTKGNQTTAAWQQVFLVSAAMVVLPDVLHLFFGTSELQPWNSPEADGTEMADVKEELQKLNVDAELKENDGEEKK